MSNATQTAKSTTAAKTYTVEDILHGVFYPFTGSTTAADLPDTAWLMVAGKHLAELTDMSIGDAVEAMALNQATALDGRAQGLTCCDVAVYAARHEVG